MALMKIAIFLLIYCLKTVYVILNCVPIVSTFIKIAERIVFFYLWSLLLACRIVRSVGSFCFAALRWSVFVTFLPIYIPIWITTRLLFAVLGRVSGYIGQKEASNWTVFIMLRLMVLKLPVIGPMFASAECRIMYLLNIPISSVRSMQDKVTAVQTDVNAMLDQANRTSCTEIILGCLSTQRSPVATLLSTRREARPADDVQLLSVESSDHTGYVPVPFKRPLLLLPFGKEIIDFTETILELPSTCTTRCEDLVRTSVETFQVVYGFPQEVLNSIKDLKDRLAKVESYNEKQSCRFRQLTDEVASQCNNISQVQRDLACRLAKQDEDHQQHVGKLRLEHGEVQLMTKNDMLKILSKVDEAVEKIEMVTKRLAVDEQPNRVTLPNPEASSTAEVPLHAQPQANAENHHQAYSSFSFPGLAFARRWFYNRG